MLKRTSLLTAMILTPVSALAAEDNPAWTGSAELGSIVTSGNTDTQSLNGSFSANHKGGDWEQTIRLDALTSKEDDVTSKEKYSILGQLDRNFTEHSYAAIVAQQERARFSGYVYQSTVSVNYGYRAINQDDMKLDLEVGPGYRRDKLKESDEIQEEAIGRLALDYSWTISEGTKFIELMTAEIGSDNSVYKSETGLQSQLQGNLATKITYKIKYVEEVPEETENTDREFGVTLVYSF